MKAGSREQKAETRTCAQEAPGRFGGARYSGVALRRSTQAINGGLMGILKRVPGGLNGLFKGVRA